MCGPAVDTARGGKNKKLTPNLRQIYATSTPNGYADCHPTNPCYADLTAHTTPVTPHLRQSYAKWPPNGRQMAVGKTRKPSPLGKGERLVCFDVSVRARALSRALSRQPLGKGERLVCVAVNALARSLSRSLARSRARSLSLSLSLN